MSGEIVVEEKRRLRNGLQQFGPHRHVVEPSK